MAAGTESADLAGVDIECTHTPEFAALLRDLRVSLVVSTYQANKIVLLRERGGVVNTHFRNARRPMGIAFDGQRLGIGTQYGIRFFENQPGLIPPEVEGPAYDACYVPTKDHVTGAIDIHEMEYAADGTLWFVNTRLSCLCRFDADFSFRPVWRPSFISELATEDRCHLNGLGLVNGEPRFVSALGVSNEAGGWRANKAAGGVVFDLESGETVLSGLSMPHSPRFYQGQLWVLESGRGGLIRMDLLSGQHQDVALLPGFTRGIDFCGPVAFIGLSQVRESATFSGLPLTQQPVERVCGVAAVDIRNGRLLGYLRFEAGVRELFSVRVLPGQVNPELLDPDESEIANVFRLPPGESVKISALSATSAAPIDTTPQEGPDSLPAP